MLQKQKCPPQVRKLVHKAARDIVKILIDDNCLRNPKGEFTPDILPLIKLWQYHCIYYKKERRRGWTCYSNTSATRARKGQAA